MSRRVALALAALCVCGLAAFYAQKPAPAAGKLLVLEWAAKSSLDRPPVAVLVEFGLTDVAPADWSGAATVAGAKVVHREGYRFREKAGDKLADPDGWSAATRRGLRAPAKQPAVAKMEPIATVGVVFHLADLTADATLTIAPKSKPKAEVKLADVVAGRPAPLWDGAAKVRLVTTAAPVAADRKTENDFPAACYGPDGTLYVAWVGYHVQEDARRIEVKNITKQPDTFAGYLHPAVHDQVFLKAFRGGKWADPVAVTDANQDIIRCAVAASGTGGVTVAYSAKRDGPAAVFTREYTDAEKKAGGETRVSKAGGPPAVNPNAMTDSLGGVNLVWHTAGAEPSVTWRRGGAVTSEGGVTGASGGGVWAVGTAAGPGGALAITHDGYFDGDYDIGMARGKVTPDGIGNFGAPKLAGTSKFEARPSACYDAAGRLWVAYEEGPELWGKDFGALDADDGEPLYSSRSVRVVCLVPDGDKFKLMKPVAELPTNDVKKPGMTDGQRYEGATRYGYPQIGIDGKGRVWLTYRQKFGTRQSSHPGSYWLTFARRLDGDRWTDPVEVHHSCGLFDHRPVLLPHKAGGLLIVHNTDGRLTTPENIHNQIYLSHIDLPGEPAEPKLAAHDAGAKNPKTVERQKTEAASVKRIREYRVEAGGKTYMPLRGEFHRHTEISWDGGPDGSLEDMFRYGADCAAFDWIGNGDHDAGAGREYSWWLIQKFTDAYTTPGFTGMFTYERSVAYPHGHRNCMFARRGVRTLPRLSPPGDDPNERVAGVSPDDTKMLYRYLRELNGICASHTSATSMGTDWRDNDPEVEPVVEIYQGDRMSYEMQGAPRAGFDPKSNKVPQNIAGWFPAGFIDLALGQKGYKLGFQASSDHWSTHISYCVVLAEKPDRDGIVAAIKKRHTYGATDDIVCDVRSGGHIMGDAFEVAGAPAFDVRVIGTAPLKAVEVLKNSKVVATLQTAGAECKTTWTDPQPGDGTNYYYVRVQQADGELAWTSPMWVTFKK